MRLLCLLFALAQIFCRAETKDSNGETKCLASFLKELGKSRETIEAEATAKGIEGSKVIIDTIASVGGKLNGNFIIDCEAEAAVKQLSIATGGEQIRANDSKKVGEAIVDIINRYRKNPVDVAILLDNTGSMTDDIAEVNKTLSLIRTAVGAVNGKLTAASYKDKNVDSPWYTRNVSGLIDPSSAEISNFLAALGTAGGGDIPESFYDAVYKTADEVSWISSRRLLIVLTDAGPLAGSKSQYNEDTVKTLLISKSIILVTIIVGY